MTITASTAATDGTATGRATAAAAEATVRQSVLTLVRVREADRDDLARHLGIHRSSLYRKLGRAGAPFTAGEVAAIADYFGVPVADLFAGLAAVAIPLQPAAVTRSSTTAVGVIGAQSRGALRLAS